MAGPRGVLRQAYEASCAGAPRLATDLVVGLLDDLLSEGAWEGAAGLLRSVDLGRLPTQAITGLLCVARHAEHERRFAGVYPAFWGRSFEELSTRSLGEERMQRLVQRFAPRDPLEVTYTADLLGVPIPVGKARWF